MGITVLTGILNHGFMIAAAGIGAFMVRSVATGAAAEALSFTALVLGGVVAGRAVAAWAEMWLAHDLAYRILAELRIWLYQALDRLAPRYLLDRRSGDLSIAAMADVDTIEWFYAHTVGTFVVAVVVPLGALLTLAAMHWLLPLVLLPATLAVATVPFLVTQAGGSPGPETARGPGFAERGGGGRRSGTPRGRGLRAGTALPGTAAPEQPEPGGRTGRPRAQSRWRARGHVRAHHAGDGEHRRRRGLPGVLRLPLARALSGCHHPRDLHLRAGDQHHRHRGEPRRGLRGG